MTDSAIEKLIHLNKSDFEYKEWLALKYVQAWAFNNGKEPENDDKAEYEKHFSEEQRKYIKKIMHMMRFTNSLGNSLTPESMRPKVEGNASASLIENKEYIQKNDPEKENNDLGKVPVLPPVIFVLILIPGLFLHKYLSLGALLQSNSQSNMIGNVLFVISGIIMVSTTRLMIKKKTALRHNQETTTIVSSGFFRYSRNPLYLSLLLVFCGIAFHVNSLWLFLLLPALLIALDRGVVVHEERYLERTFGDVYLQYKKKVRRWI